MSLRVTSCHFISFRLYPTQQDKPVVRYIILQALTGIACKLHASIFSATFHILWMLAFNGVR